MEPFSNMDNYNKRKLDIPQLSSNDALVRLTPFSNKDTSSLLHICLSLHLTGCESYNWTRCKLLYYHQTNLPVIELLGVVRSVKKSYFFLDFSRTVKESPLNNESGVIIGNNSQRWITENGFSFVALLCFASRFVAQLLSYFSLDSLQLCRGKENLSQLDRKKMGK